MFSIQRCPLPENALLGAYLREGAYTDCYTADVSATVSHEQYVTAFYTTAVFKLERLILKYAIARPSTDGQARQLAAGSLDRFAAWDVEKRAANQVLLRAGRTRSWLMVAPLPAGSGTRLYFGSAVVPARGSKTGKPALGFPFGALLGFHKQYSQVLLHAARKRLRAGLAAHPLPDPPPQGGGSDNGNCIPSPSRGKVPRRGG